MRGAVERLTRGAVSGLAATGPMTLFMEAFRRGLPPPDESEPPPKRVTRNAVDTVADEDHLSEAEMNGLTAATHLGYGTGAGGAYGFVAPHLPFSPAVNGVA